MHFTGYRIVTVWIVGTVANFHPDVDLPAIVVSCFKLDHVILRVEIENLPWPLITVPHIMVVIIM